MLSICHSSPTLSYSSISCPGSPTPLRIRCERRYPGKQRPAGWFGHMSGHAIPGENFPCSLAGAPASPPFPLVLAACSPLLQLSFSHSPSPQALAWRTGAGWGGDGAPLHDMMVHIHLRVMASDSKPVETTYKLLYCLFVWF